MIDESKLTPWFPAHIKPVRPGVYERDRIAQGFAVYSLWTGRIWRAYKFSVNTAATEKKRSKFQNLSWRGLAKKP